MGGLPYLPYNAFIVGKAYCSKGRNTCDGQYFVAPVNEFCFQVFTVQLILQPKMGLTCAISV